MRLVLDTNIYISALIQPYGPPGRLLRLMRRGHPYVLVSSRTQLQELTRVLGYPRFVGRIHPEEAAELRDGLPLLAELAAEPLLAVDLSPDPADNFIIATALAGRADAIVTGDKRHLLSLETPAGVRIVTARAALIELGNEQTRQEDR